MSELLWRQYVLIGIVFVWSGFVRSGLGFGGAVLSLPFLLLILDQPLVFLPIIAVQLLIFSSLTVMTQSGFFNNTDNQPKSQSSAAESNIDWDYLKYALGIMIIPKIVGVFGLITLPPQLMNVIIFSIVLVYAFSYVLNKPFRSRSKTLDALFLILGGYISGTSLIGAPLIIAVFATHVAPKKLRNTLFTLWFILVSIKMAAFIYADVDLQLMHQLWLLPCAAVGHFIGLHVHERMLKAENATFYRVLGSALITISIVGLWKAFSG